MNTKNHFPSIYLLAILLFFSATAMGQRKMELLDRGVVAIPKSATQMYISWRHFATDPDDIAYNVYYRTSSNGITYSEEIRVNPEPITNSTNFTANMTTTTYYYNFYVKSVINGVEKEEAGNFIVPKGSNYFNRIIKDFDFEPLPPGYPKMFMKFCWPADLDGDGKYDFVMDRQNYGAAADDAEGDSALGDYAEPLIEAYSSEGKFLWRMSLGYNVKICTGHNDMVTAYDMDGDGKAEVMVAVSEGTCFSDGTLVVGSNGKVNDYTKSAGSAPQWISILDGMTGKELDRIAVLYDQIPTTRSDKWKDISGHFIIAYLDGIHPSLIYQYKNRKADGNFQGAFTAVSFKNGKFKLEWEGLSTGKGAEFHQVRAADVDFDGYDEFVEGGHVIDQDGSVLNIHQGVVHGDRHVLTDIDPDRPGLEHFFVQQINPSTLGMGLADAETGELIKGLYLPAVGDIGRGTCAAFDPTRRGLQFFATMNSYLMYDCKGNAISGSTGTFPAEALWWGSDLSRYHISSAGNDKNPILERYNSSSKSFDRVQPNLYHENNGHGSYYFRAPNAGRAAFWGDLLGDWREELLYCRTDSTGFVIISTWEETSHRLYTLMQNPAYRAQTTARGYYETADVDYYMAADMPAPPVAPVQKADLYYAGNAWVDDNELVADYADGKSIMFDLREGNSSYTLNNDLSPSRLWLMNPKGKNYTFDGNGKFTGPMDVIKSMLGDVVFNGNHDYMGITHISEGRLFVNGSLASKVRVDARGVIGGNATLAGGIVMESGLNVEGGRIEPGMPDEPGTMSIAGNLELLGRNNLAFDVDQTHTAKNDILKIEGELIVTGTNNGIIINPLTPVTTGVWTLVTFSATNATPENFKITGLEGIPYNLFIEENSIRIEVTEPRSSGSVVWAGTQSSFWDFHTKNFLLEGTEDFFVPGDRVLFDDEAAAKIIIINEVMPAGGLLFENDTDYKISGSGAISGTGGLKKSGSGKLSLLTTDNSFTGGVEIDGGILEVASLKNGGETSSIGASIGNADNWVMKNATLQTSAQMATNRSMRIEGKLTVNNPTTTTSVLISGNIGGAGANLEITGKGTLTLQGSNTLETVRVKDGLLLLGSVDANNHSVGNAKVILEGGIFRMFDVNSTSTIGPFSNEIHVPEGASAQWDLPKRWRFTNKLTGSGTITINAPYVRSDFNGDWSEFMGIIKFTGSDIRLNSTAARNMPNAEVNLGNSTYLCVASNGSGESNTQATFTFGALSGSGPFPGKHNLIVGDRNTNSTYSGNISSGSGKITKRGSGALTLSGNNLYTGGTTVNDGKLIVTNTTGSATGTGPVTIASGAKLMGNGTIGGNVYIQDGASLMPGIDEAALGTLKIGGILSIGNAAATVIKINNTSNDLIQIDKSLIMNGTLEILNLGRSFTSGDSFRIFEAAETVQGVFSGIIPETPGTGLYWDTSRLSEGILGVTDVTGIDNPDSMPVSVYPTKVENVCYVSLDKVRDATVIELINQMGVILYAWNANPGSIQEINMSGYSRGIYFIRIISKEKPIIKRIIK